MNDTAKDDGGQAFPSPDWNGNWNGPHANHGMSLRDWFAGQVLVGFSFPEPDGSPIPQDYGQSENDALRRHWRNVSEAAYIAADAMLAARKEG